MASRLELQTTFEEMLGTRNVYYQTPSNVTMQYDAIRYSLSSINTRYANDKKYKNTNCYDVIVISRRPDPAVIHKILELPHSTLNRPYVADNLYHYPITLYY